MRDGETGLAVEASIFFLGGMLEEELDDDLNVDEEKISACAPYLARQMSCLGRGTPIVKDTPFLGSARGAKEAKNHFTHRKIVGDEWR